MPTAYRDDAEWIPASTSEDWKVLERYWYHAFNEWFITKKLYGGRFKQLWDEYYQKAIMAGLKYQAYRHALYDLLYTSNFSGHRMEFKHALMKLCGETGLDCEREFDEYQSAIKP